VRVGGGPAWARGALFTWALFTWALFTWALAACSLDFDITGREFACPPELTGCRSCNPDGTCRVPMDTPDPTPAAPPRPDPPAPPDAGGPSDAGSAPPVSTGPDASLPTPPEPTLEPCGEFQARTSDSLCLDGSERCFSLGSVLSPSLMAWLDPTTLPADGSGLWCDRSGKGHHAQPLPDAGAVRVEGDERTAGDGLARSLTLNGGWLSFSAGSEPVLRPGNFAVLIAAATPIEASDSAALDLFESGANSRLTLSVGPDTGQAVGSIVSLETALVPAPVVSRSSVYDGRFHLYTLYRRSEVRVLDDVLQLRLNGVLEFRGSSIAIPRALDLSSPLRVGGSGSAQMAGTGRGRIAAVIILRGSVPEDELARLETFLCEALDVCAAPGPRLGTEPPSPLDGGL
jgi:hypothetical protein